MSQSRQERRAAERQERKNLRKQMPAGSNSAVPAASENSPSSDDLVARLRSEGVPENELFDRIAAHRLADLKSRREEFAANRAAQNRANAQHSSGPRTEEGKANSSRNSFKHGLYAKGRVMTDEEMKDFDHFKLIFVREFQPASGTEMALIFQMTEHYIRLQRFQTMESNLFASGEDVSLTHLNALHRFINSAERGFHKSLKALREMQKDRRKTELHAPPIPCTAARHNTEANETPAVTQTRGFVPQNAKAGAPPTAGNSSQGRFVPQNTTADPSESRKQAA